MAISRLWLYIVSTRLMQRVDFTSSLLGTILNPLVSLLRRSGSGCVLSARFDANLICHGYSGDIFWILTDSGTIDDVAQEVDSILWTWAHLPIDSEVFLLEAFEKYVSAGVYNIELSKNFTFELGSWCHVIHEHCLWRTYTLANYRHRWYWYTHVPAIADI